ncbi:TetR/AcrR family transcriptional regulator [Gracilibacillus sp. S3-1-1]|uniref:TetR/AcrR family transcriptional regulator n=1 Tax=Gracilibacillus pellucidus TaxID=3095368 RepID=A0ACC6M0B1_9BACI|nr:TetR/AcrR family transcriptional regulator [Gracilibacillus sp. S3-1-1]MDX8044379.1 TetR/AcrR family transcriptional regulator [Gracilibacillus sp. S3-1-1]
MSYQTIKQEALHLFSIHGFEGTSLADIANRVGIKKQSIYTHFKGKDDLYIQVLKDAFIEEIKLEKIYVQEHFEQTLDTFLWQSLQNFINRFHNDDRLKFWLRNTSIPPQHLHDEVITYLYQYIDQVDELYLERIQHAYNTGEITQDPFVVGMAFSALVDSIGVELIYGGETRTKRKLKAAWHIFWLGISHLDNARL